MNYLLVTEAEKFVGQQLILSVRSCITTADLPREQICLLWNCYSSTQQSKLFCCSGKSSAGKLWLAVIRKHFFSIKYDASREAYFFLFFLQRISILRYFSAHRVYICFAAIYYGCNVLYRENVLRRAALRMRPWHCFCHLGYAVGYRSVETLFTLIAP